MYFKRQIDENIWELVHNNVPMFRSEREHIEKALSQYKGMSQPKINLYSKRILCDFKLLELVPGTIYWYTADLKDADAQFDIRTVCSYLVAGYPSIRKRVLSMTHAEIFEEAFKQNLIKFVGAYVVPINIGEMK